uniref:Cytochrome P450 n=1 Tax=Leptobrachium leishanense TaxID=445787 RepID=A0A8C5Q370_9ANUR
MQFHHTYGDICTIYLGSRPVILVNGYKAVKEAMVDRGDDFLARGDLSILDAYFKNHGVAYTSDMHRWRELRRFSLTALRDFGMGKKSTEEKIQVEAACVVTELNKMQDIYFDPRECLTRAPCNIIFSIMFGNRVEYNNEELLNLINYMYEAFRIISSPWGQLYDMFPRIMWHLPGRHHMLFEYLSKLQLFVEKRVKLNKETLDPNNPRDYIDAFLIRMEKEKMDLQSEFTLWNLLCTTIQIFFAGTESLGSTLTYSLMLMMKYPDVCSE